MTGSTWADLLLTALAAVGGWFLRHYGPAPAPTPPKPPAPTPPPLPEPPADKA